MSVKKLAVRKIKFNNKQCDKDCVISELLLEFLSLYDFIFLRIK